MQGRRRGVTLIAKIFERRRLALLLTLDAFEDSLTEFAYRLRLCQSCQRCPLHARRTDQGKPAAAKH